MPLPLNGNETEVVLYPGATPIPGADENYNLPIGHTDPSVPACEQEGQQVDLVNTPTYGTPSGQLPTVLNWQDLTAVCPNGLNPTIINTLLFKVVASHWLTAAQIMDPLLKQYIYTDDPTTTNIRVAYNTTFDLAGGRRYPAIVIQRGAQKLDRITMGNQGYSESSYTSYTKVVTGTHRLLCLSQANGEVEALANEMFQYMTCVSPILYGPIPFLEFEVVGIGEVGFLDNLGSIMAVPIDLQYRYEYGWQVLPVAPLVSGFEVDGTSTIEVTT